MTSNERNIETQEVLKNEIKSLKEQCIDTCNIINNVPQVASTSNEDEAAERTNSYVEGVKTEIQNANAIILKDEHLLTSHFLYDVKEKTAQIEELTAFTRGLVHDFDNEIRSLREQIRVAQEAKKMPKSQQKLLTMQHLQKARERFFMMKGELHGLINSLYPDSSDAIIDFLGTLMAERLNETSSGYVPITSENYHIVGLLMDINILTANPYNNMEVKLAD